MKKLFCFIFIFTASLAMSRAWAEGSSRIGVDDVLQIRTITPAGLNRTETYRVDGNGYIRHSVVGKIKLIDISADQAENFIENYMARLGTPDGAVKITVFPSNGAFTVAGEVKNPGEYAVRGKLTVAAAIQSAGGLKKPATGETVRLKRKGSTTKHFSLAGRGSMLVRPGDEIAVLK